jgi:hypothetical protein
MVEVIKVSPAIPHNWILTRNDIISRLKRFNKGCVIMTLIRRKVLCRSQRIFSADILYDRSVMGGAYAHKDIARKFTTKVSV